MSRPIFPVKSATHFSTTLSPRYIILDGESGPAKEKLQDVDVKMKMLEPVDPGSTNYFPSEDSATRGARQISWVLGTNVGTIQDYIDMGRLVVRNENNSVP
jgi:hypothetical protein